MPEFLNIPLMDWQDFWDLVLRSIFNLIVVLYIVRYLYYKTTPRKDYLFTYILISQVIFFILFLLENVNVQMGFALGLFAIFGIIRYRTRQIPIREMTYLFLVIGITVINSLANRKVSYAELLLTNVAFLVLTHLLEKVFLLKHETKREVIYENVELIKPEKRTALKKDLENRTGLKINRVEIGRIDYLRDSVRLYIYFFERDGWTTTGSDLLQLGEGDDDD
ncbi:MAG: DUF4956 domain-containing protein [Bacteroidota bacterium]